jgi:hypothetical protein
MFGGAPLTEPEPVNDDYVEQIATIEPHGPCVRIVFCVEDTLHDAGNEKVLKVRRKLIMPRDALFAIIEKIRAFLAPRGDQSH